MASSPLRTLSLCHHGRTAIYQRLLRRDIATNTRDARSASLRAGCALPHTPLRFSEIIFVDFEADKLFHATALRGDRGISNAQKRVEHGMHARHAMQLDP